MKFKISASSFVPQIHNSSITVRMTTLCHVPTTRRTSLPYVEATFAIHAVADNAKFSTCDIQRTQNNMCNAILEMSQYWLL